MPVIKSTVGSSLTKPAKENAPEQPKGSSKKGQTILYIEEDMPEEETPAGNDSYGEYSDEQAAFIEKEIKKGKAKYQPKKKKANPDEYLVLEQNEYQKAKHEAAKQEKMAPQKGMKFKKVLDKKKTVSDKNGDQWEVVEKRESNFVERPVHTDSDAGSELSYD